MQSILKGLKMKRAVRTVEVDVWPPLSESEQLRAIAVCGGEQVAKYEDPPRLLESAHHKAIMVLAEFLWRMSTTPPPVRVRRSFLCALSFLVEEGCRDSSIKVCSYTRGEFWGPST